MAEVAEPDNYLLIPTSGRASIGFRVTALDATDQTAISSKINVTPLPNGWSFAGALDTTFVASVMPDRSIAAGAIGVMPDGGLLIGGTFNEINGTAWTKSLARLSATGELIPSFEIPEIGNKEVHAISIDADGRYVAAWQDGNRQKIGRFVQDGTADEAFAQSSLQGSVATIDSLPDGTTLVRGGFSIWDNASYSQSTALLGSAGDLTNLSPTQLESLSTYGPEFRFEEDIKGGETILSRVFAGDVVDQSFRLSVSGAFRSNRDSISIDEESRSLFLHGKVTGINGTSTLNFVRVHLKRPAPRITEARAVRSGSGNALLWSSVTDAAGYNVYGVDSRGRFSLIDSVAAPMVTFDHANASETQRYAIASVTSSGESRPSQPFDTTGWIPVPPDGVTWFSSSSDSIRLTWSDVEADDGYTVKWIDRREFLVGSTPSDVTSYVFQGIREGKDYDLAVGTISTVGNVFDNGLTVTARTLDGPPPAWDADLQVIRLDSTRFFVGFNARPDAAFYRISSDQLALSVDIPSTETGAILTLDTPGGIGGLTANAFTGIAEVPSEDVTGRLLSQTGNFPGAVDRSYNTRQDSLSLDRLALDSRDRLVVAGSFSYIDTVSRRGIARLLPGGELDLDFVKQGTPTSDWRIDGDYDLAVLPGDTIRIKNNILDSNGEPLARYLMVPLGTAPYPPGSIIGQSYAMARFGDGAVMALGEFYTNPPELANRSGVIFDKDGVFDRYVDFNTDGIPTGTGSAALLSMPDGRVLVGGRYLISRDGSIDADTFSNHPFGAAYEPQQAELQGNDHIVLIGNFSDGVNPARRVIRFSTDGQFDPQFAINAQPDTFVRAMDVSTNGAVHLVGAFEHCGSHQSQFVARLKADGTVDESFAVQPDAFSFFGADVVVPSLIAVQSDGDIIAGERLMRILGASKPERTFSNAVIGRTESSGLRVMWSYVSGALGYAVEEKAVDGWRWIAAAHRSSTELILSGYAGGTELRVTPLFPNLEGKPAPVAVDVDGFPAWLVSFGLVPTLDPGDDPDGDGVPLVVEYGLSLSPVEQGGAIAPALVRTDDGGLAFAINDPKSDVDYRVEISDDLQNWLAAAPTGPGSSPFAIPLTDPDGFGYARLRLIYR